MELSKYCEENETLWNKTEHEKVDKLIKYINSKIDKDLYEVAKTSDSMEVFNKLKLWIFNFYNKELLDGFDYIKEDINRFKKQLIYSLIIAVTKDKSNIDLIYNTLKKNGVIEKMIAYDDEVHEIITKDFGRIQFIKANNNFKNDTETLKYIDNLGDRVIGGCHEISLYLIKNYEIFKAVTSICKKGIDQSYYHSFVLDDNDNVIDYTVNVIMPKKEYYLLNEVQELNCIDYKEYLEQKDKSIGFDESKTLQNLLRNALYKQYQGDEI